MQNPIIIEFEQTFEHVLDLGKVHTKRYRWYWIALAALIFLQFPFYFGKSYKDWLALLIPLGTLAVLWIVILPFVRRRMSRNPKNQGLYGKRKTTFWENHIDYETPTGKGMVQWDAIVDFKASKLNYFLYLSTASAMIVPKDAFANEEEKSAFEALCSKNIPAYSKKKNKVR